MKRKGKPEKIECEICGCKESEVLEHHHVIPRTEINTDHSYWNLCVLCPTCHSRHHLGSIRIIGIYPSTKLPLGRTVIYEEDGKNNSGITEPYYIPKPKSVKYYGKKDKGSKQKD